MTTISIIEYDEIQKGILQRHLNQTGRNGGLGPDCRLAMTQTRYVIASEAIPGQKEELKVYLQGLFFGR